MDTQNYSQQFIYKDWILVENQFNPSKVHHRETVFTIGNGYLGTRGTFEEGYTHAQPATFIQGVFDNVPIVYTELANCPDWIPLIVFVDGDRFRLERGKFSTTNDNSICVAVFSVARYGGAVREEKL